MADSLLTVLMPVYNSEKFLKAAIESILNQTYENFEFLIINDGSNDSSLEIINSYKDKRIRLVNNPKNLGLINTLNLGIELAKGKYIARMDGDDISMPDRLMNQITFLNSNPEVSLVAGQVQLINEDNVDLGYWPEDVQAKTESEIKELLPFTNCIAHPTILIRTEVAKKFLYNKKQINNEDWDLWLRLVSSGHKIAKINQPLLKYRIHSNSITFKSNQKNVSKKLLVTQKNYLFEKIKTLRINSFDLKVLSGLISNASDVFSFGIFIRLNRSVNKLFRIKIPKKIHRLTMLFRFMQIMKASENKSGIFFFFPFYHVGGAERVHIDILKTVADKEPWTFITNESENDAFYAGFSKYGKVFDISSFSGKYKWLTKKIISGKINKTNKALTFGCNSHFYYKLIPFLNKDVKCIDLLHAFSDKGIAAAEDWSLPYVDRLSTRVFISKKAILDLKTQYQENNILPALFDNIQYIANQVEVPEAYFEKEKQEHLKVLYVGRGTNEKRVHLVAEIAKQCSDLKLAIEFELIGNIKNSIDSKYYKYLKFSGEIKDPEILVEKYRQSDLLLITSSREGFPMVIMEGMANGVVPLSTDVGDISSHVAHDKNGIVVTAKDEAQIVKIFVEGIHLLYADREKLSRLSKESYYYAKNNFDFIRFRSQYRKLILGENQN